MDISNMPKIKKINAAKIPEDCLQREDAKKLFTYKDNMVFEICINNFGNYKVMLNNIDLFHTKVEDILIP